jgi:hypothetical protein
MIVAKAFYVENLKSASLAVTQACRGGDAVSSADLGIQPEQSNVTKHIALNMGRACYYRAYFGNAQWDRMHTFSFVRNPWSRTVALWSYLTNGGKDMDFERFVENVAFMQGGIADCGFDIIRKLHVASQWHNLSDGSKLIVRSVCKVEDGLDAGFVKMGLKVKPVRIINKGNYGDSWREFYTDETRNCIRVAYAEDIEVFGYGFE